jgi:integrase
VQAQRLDIATQERYEQHIRLHIVPILGRIALARLTAQQIQTLYTLKLGEGLSARTIRHVHAVLHSALKSAVRLGTVPFNVCERVDPPRPARTEMRPLTQEQAQAFLQAIQGDRLEALFVLAIHTGMRQGELLGLRWCDVDLDGATLQVRGTLQRVPGHKRIKDPKTANSRRRVALSAQALEALRAHRARQLAERLALGPEWHDDGLVFPGPTCATLPLLGGVHPKVVSEMLGHSTISITLDTYSHVLPTMQRDAAATLERLFGS